MTEPLPGGYHGVPDALLAAEVDGGYAAAGATYAFENFFHPFVGQLIEQLNRYSIDGLLDPDFHAGLATDFFTEHYTPLDGDGVTVEYSRKEIDVGVGGPYANYNWELLFHVPVAVAVHLSDNQRFAEAQRWFHRVFDPTNNDTTTPAPDRYWRFLRFRHRPGEDARPPDARDIAEQLQMLATPDAELTADQQRAKRALLEGYAAVRNAPFQPHRVAATRPVAYQYHVVMKYLDNLIAWGDSLFREDTAESVAEATQRYVLASNILGPRPQRTPSRGTRPPRTFAQLRGQLDEMGNALVELESVLPFDAVPGPAHPEPGGAAGVPVLGIGRTLYFCVPRNEKLLGYWDRVAERLDNVRNCRNLQGVARPLALFDPPIDPALLIEATAAGIDTGAAAAEALAPVGILRGAHLLTHAIELAGEVRALGAALLAALEKGDAEALALLRQHHEVRAQRRVEDVRLLQWRQAQAATDALVRSRDVVLERHRWYRRLLGLDAGDAVSFTVARTDDDPSAPPMLVASGFAPMFDALVKRYDTRVPVEQHGTLRLAGGGQPERTAGASGAGRLNLSVEEDQELNTHLPTARDLHLTSSVLDTVAGVVTMIPSLNVDLHFWGLGVHSDVFSGVKLAEVSKIAAGVVRTVAAWEQDQAGMAARTASYERRADEWTFLHNQSAKELEQLGRQILGSIIAEQAVRKEYRNATEVTDKAREAERFLRTKFTGQELYGWMQGELTRLFHDYHRFAVDVARRAEQALRRELASPELDAVTYVARSYGEPGRAGLLAGEQLVLDLRRLDLAHRENRRREYELVRHVSLAQLDPLALLRLRATGTCEVSVPEALFDLDCPGHYLRRLVRVSLSVPAVTGPWTGVHATLSLLRSSVRTSSATGAGYARSDGDDQRFTDHVGTIPSVVTSTGHDDSGMFDTAADERYLPFEGAGAVGAWRIELPGTFRQFDYGAIPDVVLHLRYTARDGGTALRDAAVADLTRQVAEARAAGTARLFSMRHDFPDAWARLRRAPAGTRAELAVELTEGHYPYWSAGRARQVRAVELLARPAAGVTSLSLFDAADAPAASVTLVEEPGTGGLLRGGPAAAALPAAVGTVRWWLTNTDVDDLWMILTWGA